MFRLIYLSQPFSKLGTQPGLNCKKSGNLFLEIVRFLRVSQPKAFFLENVPGLLGMEKTFKIIVTALEDCGYDVTWEVISARGLTATGRKRLVSPKNTISSHWRLPVTYHWDESSN